MEQKLIEGTKYSPRIEMNEAGLMILTGRCIMEDSIKFFNPILEWIESLNCQEIIVEFRLEYVNTSSSKQLLSLVKLISGNPLIKSKYVKWFYESDDEDMLDMGKDFESIANIPFDFYEMSGQTA
jgi:hypothetical protein